MDKYFGNKSVVERINWLQNQLNIVLNSPFLSYQELMSINNMGLYIVLSEDEILYVGKTTRAGKMRLRELATDYRSHTFNNKMLLNHFFSKGYNIPRLNRNAKNDLIKRTILDLDQFKAAQKSVNEYIKSLTFKFLATRDIELNNIEHFAISVLKPTYND